MNQIFYTDSYKYRLSRKFIVRLVDCPLLPRGVIEMPFASIQVKRDEAFLHLELYYGWDGATWALDSKNFRRGSACHDALLEMIGLGLLPADPWKKYADHFLIKLCQEDGMWWPRIKWVYQAVSKLGDPKGSKKRPELSAP